MGKVDNYGPIHESEANSVRQIRIWYSDIEDKRDFPFIRHWT